MSNFKIIGTPNPEIGKEVIYKISTSNLPVGILPAQTNPFGSNPFTEQVKWSIYILESGKWILKEKNNKTGPTANYTFTEISLKRKGIRIVARLGEEKSTLDIKPHDTIERKIVKVELCDALGNLQTKPFAYNQTVLAKVHCLNLDNCTVHVTLWEDDAPGKGHSEINKNNKAITKTELVANGIAEVKFRLVPDFAKIADAKLAKGDKSEGKTHEYYVTAEVFRQETKSSNNINVINPNDTKSADTKAVPTPVSKKPVSQQKPVPKSTAPASKKGPSKKEEKKVKETSSGSLFDWGESLLKAVPDILPSPSEIANSVAKLFMPDGKKDGNKETCKCKEYDLIWGNKVSCDFRKKVVEISKSLWPDKYKSMANGLMAVMRVETSETFSPSKIELISYVDGNGKKKKKYAGLSKEAVNKLDDNFIGAVGLIQFTKDAIDALNKENSLNLTKKKLALMSDIDQLDYVKKYFMLYNWYKKLLSPEDIYLQVFAPIGIAKEEDYVLYKKYENPQTDKERTSTKNYNANKSVDEENNNDKKIQRSEILGRYRTSYAEGMLKKEKEFSCGAIKQKEESESNGTGVLDEMKALVDKHIPYSQLGVRNSLSEKGLEGLDCSETVSIYLTKLGITTSVKEIHTGIMTTQKDFRKAIDSENIDFVSGSDSEDFKPNRGDIFVWRRSDGIGHTGIVYKYDEKTDLVTILEAIGDVGSADETTNVNNGGYSGKGNSRTAVYKRSGKALAKHNGWKGYFRPKNYTKKL